MWQNLQKIEIQTFWLKILNQFDNTFDLFNDFSIIFVWSILTLNAVV